MDKVERMTSFPALALWGGHECTVNRVGDAFLDQGVRSGHAARIDDLDLFAGLGLAALRYPVLWEQVAPHRPDETNWAWHDARMARLRTLGLRPIVGLVHHGSGPAYTSLLADDFSTGVAEHARQVAERYPWVEDWTPINEPLTTARFAALYGHWYPHRRDEGASWRALLNQIDATRLAMRAIRAINPRARLIQTEDLGRTESTKAMAAQAEFDNLRRWATWDLLCGRVTPDHPLWPRLAAFGLGDRLRRIADAACPPDMLGINHYLTSDRFLDHRTARYPAASHGVTAHGRLADVEAVRVMTPRHPGLATAIGEAWARYGLPIALTEIHNGCTREEQMRWLFEAWQIAQAQRARGVPVLAVTAWSLLGAYDWNSLLTVADGHYESGVFDIGSGTPRATAIAPMLRSLAAGETPTHPVLQQPGWWADDRRLLYPARRVRPAPARRPARRRGGARPLLITGGTGTLGRAFAGACTLRNIPFVLTERARLSLDDPASIAATLDAVRPWAVINTAGWVRVDAAEEDAAACFAANRDGSLRLGQACADRAVPYTSFSSDLVFDGLANRPYVEGDATAPLGVYGRSKAEADAALLAWDAAVLVIRTAAFFSPHDRHNFAMHLAETLRDGRPMTAASDCTISPTFVPDLVRTTLDLIIDGERGLWHLVSDGSATWAEFARELAGALKLPRELIQPRPAAAMGWQARRPPQAAMRSARGAAMPSLSNAIARFADAIGH